MLGRVVNRLRANLRGAASAVVAGQRWRSFYAELNDASIAALIDRHAARCNDDASRLMRPLSYSWLSRFTPHRVIRGFMVAACVGLCQAAWITTCTRCKRRSVHHSRLQESMFCYACHVGVPCGASLPSELVFTAGRKALCEGLLPEADWTGKAESLAASTAYIGPASCGILYPQAVSGSLILAISVPLSGESAVMVDLRHINIAMVPMGPQRKLLRPRSSEEDAMVLQTGCPVVIVNGHSAEPMRATLTPKAEPSRIGLHNAVEVPEYQDLFV